MASDLFLKFEGVKGEAKDAKYGGQIEIYSFQMGVSQMSTMGHGGGGGQGKANFSEITVSKKADVASTALMKLCANGKHLAKATITCRKAAGDKQLDYLVVEFKDVMITGVSLSTSNGSGETMESVSFAFGHIVATYTEQNKDGTSAAVAPFTYDLEQNTAA